jgi:hypothetical protein
MRYRDDCHHLAGSVSADRQIAWQRTTTRRGSGPRLIYGPTHTTSESRRLTFLSPVQTTLTPITLPRCVCSNTFSSFNGIMWKARSSSRSPDAFDFMADPELDSAGRNPSFRVMDVWPMSAKRADAHLGEWCGGILPITTTIAHPTSQNSDVTELHAFDRSFLQPLTTTACTGAAWESRTIGRI